MDWRTSCDLLFTAEWDKEFSSSFWVNGGAPDSVWPLVPRSIRRTNWSTIHHKQDNCDCSKFGRFMRIEEEIETGMDNEAHLPDVVH